MRYLRTFELSVKEANRYSTSNCTATNILCHSQRSTSLKTGSHSTSVPGFRHVVVDQQISRVIASVG
jgi:hypothetical protein